MSVKRVVVDTNIVVSALVAGGSSQRILEAWITGQFIALISEELRGEINTVLNRSKFISFDKKRRQLVGTLFNKAQMVKPKRIHKIVFSDENDHFLYELALSGEAAYIVTGDKALLLYKKISSIEIISPENFCKKLKFK